VVAGKGIVEQWQCGVLMLIKGADLTPGRAHVRPVLDLARDNAGMAAGTEVGVEVEAGVHGG
jgi:hypothetical protein